MLALVEDLTVLRLYIRLASPAIADGTFNSAVQARPTLLGWWSAVCFVGHVAWLTRNVCLGSDCRYSTPSIDT